jgi:peptidoglycan hydrolase-like protein with peptidoglycan-binding domain
VPGRDLSSADLWTRSRARSRFRHEAAPQAMQLPGRSAGIAALLLLTGGPVAGVAGANALDSSGWQPQLPTGMEGLEAAAATGPQVPSPRTKARVETAPARPRPAAPRRVGPAQPPDRGIDSLPASVAATSIPARSYAVAVTTTAADGLRPAGVQGLQQALGLPADGEFGAGTEKALRRWQREHGLPVDGVAGAATRQALGMSTGPALKRVRPKRIRHRAHKRAARQAHRARPARVRGGGVRALQRALGLPVDGLFGPGTESALKRWQRRHGLEGDGVVGPSTRKALGLGPGPSLHRKRLRHRHHRHSGGGGGGDGSSTVVARVIAAANRIATRPYVYGGGHGSFNSSGYDCSGSVSYALHGGGLLSAPLTSGAFMGYGRPGPGRHISIYASPGHVYMTIDGRRFDTSARGQSGSRWGGPRSTGGGYVVRHPAGY